MGQGKIYVMNPYSQTVCGHRKMVICYPNHLLFAIHIKFMLSRITESRHFKMLFGVGKLFGARPLEDTKWRSGRIHAAGLLQTH